MMRNRGQRTVTQVADDLGVNANQLHRWSSQFDKTAIAKRNVQGETLEEENRRLRKENERLRMEKTILKKAAAFFAKEDE
jgi:transposase